MGAEFTLFEGAALRGLLEETNRDIVLKLDRDGFLIHASSALAGLGIMLEEMLVAPRLADLGDPDYAEALEALCVDALAGTPGGGWLEFPAVTRDGEHAWYAIQLRPLRDSDGAVYGAVGLMRSIDDRIALEQQAFAASMTDSLTGLANRKAFLAMLEHLVERGAGGTLVLFGIDHFRAINLRYGASAGDRVLGAFAAFLRGMLRNDHIVARIGGETFAVLMPRDAPARAEAVAREVLAALAEAAEVRGPERIDLHASAGLAEIRGTADDTLRRAELAQVHAKARGRGQVDGADRGTASDRLAG